MIVFVYKCERASCLWSVMTSYEPCSPLDRPREMVSGIEEEEEVFGLGPPQRSRRKPRRLLSWRPVFSARAGRTFLREHRGVSLAVVLS